MLISIGASANESAVSCTYDQAGKTHITGEAKPGQAVTVRIFKKKNHVDENGNFSYTKAQKDLLAAGANLQSVLCFADETSANDKGEFTFEAKISRLLGSDGTMSSALVSDIYVVVTKTSDGEEYTEYLFVSPDERAADYITLSSMKESSNTDVTEFLKSHNYSLGVYAPVMDEIDSAKAYSLMYDYLADKEFDVADESDAEKNEEKNIAATQDLLKLVVVEALNQNKVDTIKNYETELRISESDIASWYAKPIVDDKFKSALTTRLSGKNYKNITEFDEAFKEAVILESVANPDGLNDCKEIINTFKTDIGYNSNSVIDENAIRNVMGVSYASYSALRNAIDSYSSQEGSTSSGSSGGSGGTGGKSYASTTVSGITPAKPQPINNYFNDLADASWAVDAINSLAEKNVLAGKSVGIFAPNDNITRAEFAKIIVAAFGLNTKADIGFVDVAADSWYYDYVSIAVGSGIAKGMSDSKFGPEENITRQDMAVMLMNAAKLAKNMAETDGNVSFADEAEISDYAKSAVNILTKAGIINGTGDGRFAPRANATRAQAAKLVHGLLTY